MKQRVQTKSSGGALAVAREVIAEEGTKALFRSVPITVLSSVCYLETSIAVDLAIGQNYNWRHMGYNQYLFFAGLSAGVTAVLTCPLDVIKTRMQTQTSAEGGKAVPYPSIWATIKALRAEKVRWWAGALPRCLFLIPSVPLWLFTYEYVRKRLE